MNIKTELENLDKSLQNMIQQIRVDWNAQQDSWGWTYMEKVPAEQATDTNGRLLLADLLVARANVLCALAGTEKT